VRCARHKRAESECLQRFTVAAFCLSVCLSLSFSLSLSLSFSFTLFPLLLNAFVHIDAKRREHERKLRYLRYMQKAYVSSCIQKASNIILAKPCCTHISYIFGIYNIWNSMPLPPISCHFPSVLVIADSQTNLLVSVCRNIKMIRDVA